MCVICLKPKNKILSKDLLRNCFENNSDGAGFAVIEKDEQGNDEMNVYKGIFDFDHFWKEWEPRQDNLALLHFRVASHNKIVNGKNCHPFRINDTTVLAHNGFISNVPYSLTDSDTSVFCEKVIKPLSAVNPDFWLLDEFRWFIEYSIGKRNKVIMLNVEGKYKIFNEDEGHWYQDCWFSNHTYIDNKYRHTTPLPPKKEVEKNEHVSTVTEQDVIDIKTEIVGVRELTELKTIDAEFEPEDLEEIDRRLELAQQN